MRYFNKIGFGLLILILGIALYYSIEEYQSVIPRNGSNVSFPAVWKNWLLRTFPFVQVALIIMIFIRKKWALVLAFICYIQYTTMAYLNLDETCEACGNSGFFLRLNYQQEFRIFSIGLMLSLILICTNILFVSDKK